MTGVLKLVMAVLLALALTAVPLVADWCAVSCEAAHTVSVEATPACHHTAATMPRISDIPAPCSHDHRPIVVDAATTTAVAARAAVTVSVLALTMSPTTAAASIGRSARVHVSVNSSPPVALTLATILRI